MKVLLVNGSPHKNGCTYTALMEVKKTLDQNNIDSNIMWLGTEPIAGCIGCGKCLKDGKCFRDDIVNKFLELVSETDGFIFGTPVHFSSGSGAITSFLDRVFYGRRELFSNKPAAAVVSCRRGGATATIDQINKYFSMNNMPIVTSQYWNMVHGSKPQDVLKDEEGMQTMRTLANNMAWILKCIEAGKKSGVNLPKHEKIISTNFIRE